jgi:PAS domain-containing protein
MRQTAQPVDNKLVQLFDLSLDALCIAGFDGYLRFANPAFARLLGYTQEELLARPFMDNVLPQMSSPLALSLATSLPAITPLGSSVARSVPTGPCAGSSGTRAPGGGGVRLGSS